MQSHKIPLKLPMHQHYDGAHPSLKCNSCQMIFLSFRQIQVHYRDVAKCRTCALCSRSFTDQGHFQEVSATSPLARIMQLT